MALEEKKRGSDTDSVVDEKLTPTYPADKEFARPDGHHDAPLVDLKAAALSDQVGDVFDDVRAIDLGQDGKERPIGVFLVDTMDDICSTLTSLFARDGHGLCRPTHLARG